MLVLISVVSISREFPLLVTGTKQCTQPKTIRIAEALTVLEDREQIVKVKKQALQRFPRNMTSTNRHQSGSAPSGMMRRAIVYGNGLRGY